MSYNELNKNTPYQGYIHIVRATKYRKKFFDTQEKRDFMYHLIEDVLDEQSNATLKACTVAFDHVHILVKFENKAAVTKFSNILCSRTSRLMRNAYPEIKKHKALWDGRTHANIKDEKHLLNAIEYIAKHKPDNSKDD